MRRDTRTPTFWASEPVGQLPRGQMELPLVQAPKMNLHAVRGVVDADGGGDAVCGAVGSYLANRPEDVNCAACQSVPR